MLYEELQQLPPPAFKRACGVSRQTFSAMVAVLQPQLERQGKRGGQNQLSVADQLLMTLQYWREYRTQLALLHNDSAFRLKALSYNVWSIRAFN
jgi:hypothetical protein